jgi:hypothetical protein
MRSWWWAAAGEARSGLEAPSEPSRLRLARPARRLHAALADCVPIDSSTVELGDFAENRMDLTVVGPEVSLTLGIAEVREARTQDLRCLQGGVGD